MKIYIKKSKRGSLHTALGIPQGEKIPVSKLAIKSTDSEAIRKKKQFAINARQWSHRDLGGPLTENPPLIEDPSINISNENFDPSIKRIVKQDKNTELLIDNSTVNPPVNNSSLVRGWSLDDDGNIMLHSDPRSPYYNQYLLSNKKGLTYQGGGSLQQPPREEPGFWDEITFDTKQVAPTPDFSGIIPSNRQYGPTPNISQTSYIYPNLGTNTNSGLGNIALQGVQTPYVPKKEIQPVYKKPSVYTPQKGTGIGTNIIPNEYLTDYPESPYKDKPMTGISREQYESRMGIPTQTIDDTYNDIYKNLVATGEYTPEEAGKIAWERAWELQKQYDISSISGYQTKRPGTIPGVAGTVPITNEAGQILASQLGNNQNNNMVSSESTGKKGSNMTPSDWLNVGSYSAAFGNYLANYLGAKEQPIRYPRVQPEMLNYDPAVQQALRQGERADIINRSNISNLSRGAGQALGNITASTSDIAARTGATAAQIKMQEEQQNTQLRNAAQAQNTQIEMQEKMANYYDKMRTKSERKEARTDMVQVLLDATDKALQNEQYKNMLPWLATANYGTIRSGGKDYKTLIAAPGYEYYKDGNGEYHYMIDGKESKKDTWAMGVAESKNLTEDTTLPVGTSNIGNIGIGPIKKNLRVPTIGENRSIAKSLFS